MFGNSFDFAAMDKYTKTKCCLEKRSPDILTYGILKMAQYGQMLLGQMLPGQMSLWQLTSVEDGYIEHELELELSLAKCSPIKLQG